MNVAHEYFDHPISRDFFHTFCGDFLGEGVARNVFLHAFDPTLVIKIETACRSFQNVHEWDVWHDVSTCRGSRDRLKQWFAPCVWISPSGQVLVQKRALEVSKAELERKLPKVPRMLSDLKVDNWGRLGNRIVCRDYGSCLALNHGMSAVLLKAQWWD